MTRRSSPLPAPESWPLPAEPLPICRWPRRLPSGCSAGMPGTKPIPNSGSTTSTSLPDWQRWPKDRWRPSSPFSSLRHLPFCAASGTSCAARFGGRECFFTSPWCFPGSSPCSIRTRPSSASSSSSTILSALPRTATSTISRSGTTWWSSCWLSCRGRWWPRALLLTAFSPPLPSGGCAIPARESPCPRAPATRSPNSWCCGRSFPFSSSPSRQSKLPGYVLPALPPITILTGDYLYRRRQPGLNQWILLGHAVVCGAMTMVVLLLPWFVVHGFVLHGAATPPAHALAAASLAAIGAALLILVVTKGFGVARLRPATCWILVILVLFVYGVGPFFGIPGVASTKRVIHLLDRSYSARAAAPTGSASWFPQTRPSPSFACAATMSTASRSTAAARL